LREIVLSKDYIGKEIFDWAPSTIGGQMKFLNCNGYDFQLSEAQNIFNVDDMYTVENMNVGGWSSTIKFVGIKGWYNSVMFDNVDSTTK
jgi:hypothetical protein